MCKKITILDRTFITENEQYFEELIIINNGKLVEYDDSTTNLAMIENALTMISED